MRYVLIVLGLAMLGYLGYQKYGKKPPPPPPPIELPPPVPADPGPNPVLDHEELKGVVEATKDPNANVRWEALKFLLGARVPEGDRVMFAMLRQDEDPNIRRNIIGVLSGRAGPEVTKAVVASLKDQDADVRIASIQALSKIGDLSAAPHISGLLKDTEERVRLEALNALNLLQQRKNEELRQELERQRQLREELIRKAKEAEEAAKRKGG